LMRGAMATDAALAFPNTDGVPTAIVDPNTLYYYGNSQGAILGGAYLAQSTFIDRGVLGVGGMPYHLLLHRSADFTPFFLLFQQVYPEERDIGFFMTLMQQLWDSGEAAGYGRQMTSEPLPGTQPHQVLLQDAISDAQVTTLGAHNMARAYGGWQVGEPFEEIYGVQTSEGGIIGSALAEYEHGADPMPENNTPPDPDQDTHEDTRRTFAAQEQLWHFLTTGEVLDYCDGICDPE